MVVVKVDIILARVRVVVEVVADEPLGLGLSTEEDTETVRVEETPGESVEEVSGKTKAGGESRHEGENAIGYQDGKREVSSAKAELVTRPQILVTTHRKGSKREKMTVGLRKNWCVRSWMVVLWPRW